MTLWGLTRLVESDKKYKVCCSSTSRVEALKNIKKCKPDVVVMEIDLGEDNARNLIPEILTGSNAKVLVLTGVRDIEQHDMAVMLGARGVVSKEEEPELLLKAIEKIHHGDLWINRNATTRILMNIARASAPKELSPIELKLKLLTVKEKKVLQAVLGASERKLRAIADDLAISEYTLRNHLAAIYQKLGVGSRLELYVICNDVDTTQI